MRAFLVLTAAFACMHGRGPATLENASQSASNGDYATARAMYAEIARTASDVEGRESAEIALANLEWRIDGDPAAARGRLFRLGTYHGFLEAARFDGEKPARQAIALARTGVEREKAELALVRSVVQEHLDARLFGVAAPASDLREAFELVRRMDHGRLATSLPYLDASLLLGEGGAALEAWRAYFGSTASFSLLAPAGTALERGLPAWRGGPSREIARALSASRLFDEAVLAGADADVVSYSRYLRAARKLTEAYYRDIALRRARPGAFNDRFQALTLAACAEIRLDCGSGLFGGIADTPVFARFGALIDLGDRGGQLNLHFGHAIVDEHRQVNQYGRSATVRFIVIDAMVSNGYESWSWDGRAQHGGWGEANLIVQVRPAYAEGPILDWERLAGPVDDVASETEQDWRRVQADPFAYLPGLRLRMRRAAHVRLVDSLRAHGLAGEPLRAAFVAELGRIVTESSIFAHEGRHAIDARAAPQWWRWLVEPASQAEFQAKLSEVAFAPDPALALTGGIVAPNIGSETRHGVANRRIMEGLVEWMSAHAPAIAGLDRARPLLPQLDKLNADQLRAAARSMDPLAR
jgi:hypothetical protein